MARPSAQEIAAHRTHADLGVGAADASDEVSKPHGNAPFLVGPGGCSLVWLPDVCNAWLAVIQVEHNLTFGQMRVLDSHRLAFPDRQVPAHRPGFLDGLDFGRRLDGEVARRRHAHPIAHALHVTLLPMSPCCGEVENHVVLGEGRPITSSGSMASAVQRPTCQAWWWGDPLGGPPSKPSRNVRANVWPYRSSIARRIGSSLAQLS